MGLRECSPIPNPSGSRSTTGLTAGGFMALPGVTPCPPPGLADAREVVKGSTPIPRMMTDAQERIFIKGLPQSCPGALVLVPALNAAAAVGGRILYFNILKMLKYKIRPQGPHQRWNRAPAG